MLPPIKIQIAGRDKYMRQQYETQQVKVERKDGTIAIIDRKDILFSDRIIEYLSNDYIKPLRIKLFDIDIVYAILMKLVLIFNYANNIKEKFTLVHQYGRPRHRLITVGRVHQTLTEDEAKPISSVKFIDRIVLALDIFKVEGLKIAIRFKQRVSGLQVYYEIFRDKLLVKHKVGTAIASYAENIIPLILKFKQEMNRPIMQYYGVIEDIDYTRIGDISDKKIGEIAEETLRFLMGRPVCFYFSAMANTTLSVLQSFESKFISKITANGNILYYAKPFGKISQYAQVEAVVHTYIIVDEIANDTIGNISDKTIEEITVKYS
nr:MAG TPA: hypothetical protein [Caudoviricetes sp.]